jgi:apolipoprotein N-acyltransferase
VPFGEYVPFKRLLFFADSLTRQVGDFSFGTQYTISPMDGHKIATAICYESIFPNLVRQFVKNGSELMVVITNDGWFGQSSAPYQHLRMGVVRSVENRRWMVRTANTGISAIIDPYGKIEAETAIGVRTILDGTAQFRTDQTFYTKYGDVFAYANVFAVSVFLTFTLRRKNARSANCAIHSIKITKRGRPEVSLTPALSSSSSTTCKSKLPNPTSGPTKTVPAKFFSNAPASNKLSISTVR